MLMMNDEVEGVKDCWIWPLEVDEDGSMWMWLISM